MSKMKNKTEQNLNICLLKELPYYNANIVIIHGQFNNLISNNLPTKKYLNKIHSLYDLDLFNTNVTSTPDINPISDQQYSFKLLFAA